jgi:hypothetical protein
MELDNTACERGEGEEEDDGGEEEAKIINHLSNARDVHGPLMADFEMDLSNSRSSPCMPFYGFAHPMVILSTQVTYNIV